MGGVTAGLPGIPPNLVLLKVGREVGGDWRDFTEQQPARNARHVEALVRLWQDGRLRPRVSATYPLERAPEAIARLSDRQALGKLVVTID